MSEAENIPCPSCHLPLDDHTLDMARSCAEAMGYDPSEDFGD